MGTRKNLTIGVTVNLEHYENLRLEVNGEAESAADADDLVRFLDEILGRFGRQDPPTAERVDSYRKRVFPQMQTDNGCREGVCHLLPEKLSEDVDTGPKDTRLSQPEVIAVSPARPDPKEAGTPSCEICGGNVSPAEQKMSQLFTGKTLCRACIKKVQG
jgi:hypothetical protein